MVIQKIKTYKILDGKYIPNKLSIVEEVNAFNDSVMFKPMIEILLENVSKESINNEENVVKYIIYLKRKYKEEAILYFPFLRAFYQPYYALLTQRHLITYYKTLLNLLKDPKNKDRYIDMNIALEKDIVMISEDLGIKLRKVGRYYLGLCPIHQERTPSFTVYQDTNSFYCFGCGVSGNVIELVKRVNNIDFYQSLYYLINHG